MAEGMTKKDMTEFRELLLSKRRMLAGTIGNLRGDAGANDGNRGAAAGDSADMGAETFEQDFALSLLENEGDVLNKIDVALERIEDGTYGVCLECEKKILKTRLKAIPWASYCIDCQRKAEKY
ncbi:MAG: TraR/DksA family transcriptional regulator [Planctomycetes bacterium]|nr:TraR/DksA family transcriptional regulator [Planctomycetota bacterium]